MVSEGVGGNCCYFWCFRRFSEGLKKAGTRGRRRRSRMERFLLNLKDFERKWRLGRKKGEEEEGGSPMEPCGGLASKPKTPFSHVYLCENGTFWNSQNLTRHVECC